VKLYDEIAKMAYELYEKNGREEGYELVNWLEAERIVMARNSEREKIETDSFSPPKKKKALSTKKASGTATKVKKTNKKG
jgi:hypothetical protein